MGFFDEINNQLELENNNFPFSIFVLGKDAVVIEGYKTIEKIDNNEIVVKTTNLEKIDISGKKLYIKRLEPGQMVVSGEVLNIEIKDCGI